MPEVRPDRPRFRRDARRYRQRPFASQCLPKVPRLTEAKAAGADVVGFDDLAERVKGGFMEFDVVIASPDAMRVSVRSVRCSVREA